MKNFADFRRKFEADRKIVAFDPDGNRVISQRGQKMCGVGGDDRIAENVILTASLPASNHFNFRTPCAVILNPTTNPTTTAGRRRFDFLVDQARRAHAAWAKNQILSPAEAVAEARKNGIRVEKPEIDWATTFTVHTIGLTVHSGSATTDFCQSKPLDRPPPPDPPPDRAFGISDFGTKYDLQTGEIFE